MQFYPITVIDDNERCQTCCTMMYRVLRSFTGMIIITRSLIELIKSRVPPRPTLSTSYPSLNRPSPFISKFADARAWTP